MLRAVSCKIDVIILMEHGGQGAGCFIFISDNRHCLKRSFSAVFVLLLCNWTLSSSRQQNGLDHGPRAQTGASRVRRSHFFLYGFFGSHFGFWVADLMSGHVWNYPVVSRSVRFGSGRQLIGTVFWFSLFLLERCMFMSLTTEISIPPPVQ